MRDTVMSRKQQVEAAENIPSNAYKDREEYQAIYGTRLDDPYGPLPTWDIL